MEPPAGIPAKIISEMISTFSEHLIVMIVKKMEWSRRELAHIIMTERIDIGTDGNVICLYLDGEPVVGSTIPYPSVTTYGKEGLVAFKATNLEENELIPLSACRATMLGAGAD